MGYIEELGKSLEECILSMGISTAAYMKKKMKEEEVDTILYDVTYQPMKFPPGSQPPTRD